MNTLQKSYGWGVLLLAGILSFGDSGLQAQDQDLKFQLVMPGPETSFEVLPEESIPIEFFYTTDPLDRELSGLALRLHYDPAAVTLEGITQVFEPGLFRVVQEPEPDEDDADGDPRTTRVASVIWVDAFDRKWPGLAQPDPLRLFRATFRTAPDFAGEATIRVRAISTAAGFSFNDPEVVLRAATPPFLRGDGNGDGVADLADVVTTLEYLFLQKQAPACLAGANANADPWIDIGDPVLLLFALFTGRVAPEPPYPVCGRSSLEVDFALSCENPPVECP